MDSHRGGWIEIIAGGMFSGKSEELIRRLRRSVIARQRVQVFKPIIDDRFATDEVVSRDERRLKAHAVATSAELLARVEIGVQVVGIDEVQFFDAGVVDVCMQLADAGIRVGGVTTLRERVAHELSRLRRKGVVLRGRDGKYELPKPVVSPDALPNTAAAPRELQAFN